MGKKLGKISGKIDRRIAPKLTKYAPELCAHCMIAVNKCKKSSWN